VKTLAKKHEHRRQHDLRNQLGGRLQRQHIVSDPNEEDEGSGDERKSKVSEIPGGHGQSDNRDDDGHTAEERRRAAVPSILARLSDETLPDRNGATDGDERSRDRERHEIPGNYCQGTNPACRTGRRISCRLKNLPEVSALYSGAKGEGDRMGGTSIGERYGVLICGRALFA
jgi:hypothetical protein